MENNKTPYVFSRYGVLWFYERLRKAGFEKPGKKEEKMEDEIIMIEL